MLCKKKKKMTHITVSLLYVKILDYRQRVRGSKVIKEREGGEGVLKFPIDECLLV